MSQSLSLGQKILNQRLLAEHCLSEDQANALFQELQETYPDLKVFKSLHACIKSSNAQLRHLGLEIVAMAMPANHGTADAIEEDNDEEDEDNNDDDENEEENTKKPKARPSKRPNTSQSASSTILHYAIVNKFPDEIVKKTWQPAVFQPLTQQSFVKAVLERLAQQGVTPRSTLLNLKNSAGPNSISLGSAEDVLERLLAEKWIVPTATKKKGRRSGGMSANGGIVLGPRAFCELTYFLTDEFGMDPSEIPQQIVLL